MSRAPCTAPRRRALPPIRDFSCSPSAAPTRRPVRCSWRARSTPPRRFTGTTPSPTSSPRAMMESIVSTTRNSTTSSRSPAGLLPRGPEALGRLLHQEIHHRLQRLPAARAARARLLVQPDLPVRARAAPQDGRQVLELAQTAELRGILAHQLDQLPDELRKRHELPAREIEQLPIDAVAHR